MYKSNKMYVLFCSVLYPSVVGILYASISFSFFFRLHCRSRITEMEKISDSKVDFILPKPVLLCSCKGCNMVFMSNASTKVVSFCVSRTDKGPIFIWAKSRNRPK